MSPKFPGCPGRVGQGPGYRVIPGLTQDIHCRSPEARSRFLSRAISPTIPPGRQMLTAAITQGEGMVTRSAPHV